MRLRGAVYASTLLGAVSFILLWVIFATAGGAQAQRPSNTIYELALSYRDHGKLHAQREWVSPATGEWRVETDDGVRIYTNGRYAVRAANGGVAVRIGSTRFMGYLANGTAGEALRRYLREGAPLRTPRGLAGVQVSTSPSGLKTFHFKRNGVAVAAVVVKMIALSRAARARLFTIPKTQVTSTLRERSAGSEPTLPVTAYWFGRQFAGRSAITASEHAQRPTATEQSVGYNSGRRESQAYVTMYELPSAKGRSSAIPGQMPPRGEIQVVSIPRSLEIAQSALRAFDGANGEHRYAPWPRHEIVLHNGARATVVPNISEGVQPTPSGGSVWQFAVVTDTTITWVTGGFNLNDIPTVASALRPIAAMHKSQREGTRE